MLQQTRWMLWHAAPVFLQFLGVFGRPDSGKCPDGLHDFSLYSIPLPSSACITPGTCSDSGEFDSSPKLSALASSYHLFGVVDRSGDWEDRVYMKNVKYISLHSPVSHDWKAVFR